MAKEILKLGIDEEKRVDEVDKFIYKQIDKWEKNTKTYLLACNYPCSKCKGDDPDYCLACWGDLSSGSFKNL